MNTALAEVGSFVEEPVTLFSYTSVGTVGTTAEAGDPQTVTFGTTAQRAQVENVNAKMIERSAGVYQANDKTISVRGSFTNQDMIGYDTGTYRPVDGPWRYYIGSNLYWQAVCRGVQT
jgi:hypothetical protein